MMYASDKVLMDGAAVATAAGSVVGWLPQIAALFSIVWLAIRIWETETVRRWTGRWKENDDG